MRVLVSFIFHLAKHECVYGGPLNPSAITVCDMRVSSKAFEMASDKAGISIDLPLDDFGTETLNSTELSLSPGNLIVAFRE